jgi:RNA polymerase sigma factor for flagellar operon FliA
MQACTCERAEKEKEQIINDALPFIKYTAYRLARRLPAQLSVNDLINVGIIGLLDALSRYTEGRVKLKTFVEYRIKGAMLDELRAQDWLPRSLKDKISQIRKAQRRLEKELGRSPEDDEVAKSLGMEMDDYYRILHSAGNAVVFSFEDFRGNNGQDGDLDVMECIRDASGKSPLELIEEASDKEALARLIDALPEKEKLVLSLYYWEELTMKEIGRVMNISEGRVCQIHSETIKKLKLKMNKPLVLDKKVSSC